MKNDADSTEQLFEKIVNEMHSLYEHRISECEATQAAKNLINFCKILIEMDADQKQNKLHVKPS